ncbi:MAG: hypothetical protein K2M46_08680 [Lachnospiraceae bacterium]|nr:hypothetical protein [Lachnospiraceae bacterium]
MQLIAIIVLVVLIAWANVHFGWTTKQNMGGNIGEQYMKKHWDMEPENRNEEDV